KSSISLNNISQISSVHSVAPILSTKEPKHSLSIGYEHLSITPETESDEVTESSAKNLLPIPSECKVTFEDKRECDVPVYKDSSTVDVCDNHSDILFDSNDDDISSYDDSFEDIEYIDASLSDPETASVEENVVHQEQEETPVCMLNSSASIPIFKESDNSLSLPEFETFCDHTEETRSGEVISVVMKAINEPNKDESFDRGGKINYFPFIYSKVSPLFLSAESEDTIFDPGISI
nr:hypothetical protein [Tanacetum cinerariifolium]